MVQGLSVHAVTWRTQGDEIPNGGCGNSTGTECAHWDLENVSWRTKFVTEESTGGGIHKREIKGKSKFHV